MDALGLVAITTTTGDIVIRRAKGAETGKREEKGSMEGRQVLPDEMTIGERNLQRQELRTTGMIGTWSVGLNLGIAVVTTASIRH